MIEAHLLGTASCFPTPKRGVSCTALRHDDGIWLFDCGEGSQIQLQKSDIKPGRIDKIFITHLHGDHLFGLPGLMCTIGQNNSADKKVIDLYGPIGLKTFVRTSLGLSKSNLGYEYCVHEIVEENYDQEDNGNNKLHPNEIPGELITCNANKYWEVCKSKHFSVTAHQLEHTIFCVGFVIQEDDLPGKLDVNLLKAKGIKPGPLYGKIKSGENVVLDSGEEIKAESVMGPSRKGRTMVVLGDTSNSDSVIGYATGADLLLHEATYGDDMEELAVDRGHSTAGIVCISVDVLHVEIKLSQEKTGNHFDHGCNHRK